MAEAELYKSLGELTKNKAVWEQSIPDIAALRTRTQRTWKNRPGGF